MRIALLTLVLFLISCQPSSSQACVVVRALTTEEGFKVGNSDTSDVTLKKGGCIEFINEDPTQTIHLAQSKPGTPPELAFSTRNLAPGRENGYKVYFNLAGEIEYICGLNTGTVVHARTMKGKITVRP